MFLVSPQHNQKLLTCDSYSPLSETSGYCNKHIKIREKQLQVRSLHELLKTEMSEITAGLDCTPLSRLSYKFRALILDFQDNLRNPFYGKRFVFLSIVQIVRHRSLDSRLLECIVWWFKGLA